MYVWGKWGITFHCSLCLKCNILTKIYSYISLGKKCHRKNPYLSKILCTDFCTYLSTTLNLLCTNYTVFQSTYLTYPVQHNTVYHCCTLHWSILLFSQLQLFLLIKTINVSLNVSFVSHTFSVLHWWHILCSISQHCHLLRSVLDGWNMSVEYWWNNTNTTKWSPQRKTSPSATSSTTNPTFENGLCSEKSLMNCFDSTYE